MRALVKVSFRFTLIDASHLTPVVQAASISVNDFSDTPAGTPENCLGTGVCTLRAAIQAANSDPDASVITLPPGTYTLTQTTSIAFTTPITVIGSGAGLTVIDRSNTANQDFQIVGTRVSLSGLTIRNSGDGRIGLWVRLAANVTLSEAAISANRGLGILNDGSTLILDRALISGNADGGVRSTGMAPFVVISNTTLSNNFNGPGLDVQAGEAELNNVTISENTDTVPGAGLRVAGGVTVTVRNSIVANNFNSAGGTQPDCNGNINSRGYNLIGNSGGCSGWVATDQVNVDARLGVLRDNGGRTATHALDINSPALNNGDPATCRPNDQRGVWRPQGARCDIGAFEMAYASLTQAAFTVSDAAATAMISATVANRVPFGLTVNYATSGGTARPGVDYTEVSNSLTLSDNNRPVTFTIPITGNPLYTGDLTFNVALSVPPGAGLGTPSAATVTIVDSQPPPQTRFASGTYTTLKSAGAVTALVTLNTASGVTATVNYATVNGTALAGVDFAPTGGALVFPPGQTTRPVTITLLNPGFYTGDKTFSLALSQPVSATLGAPASATIELVDDNPRRVFLPIVTRGPDFYSRPCETEPNNVVSEANGPLQSGRSVCGNYNGVNVRDDDYFYFESRNSGPIRVKLDNAISGLQVQLFYQSTANFIGFSASPPFEILYPTGAPGRYYVRVVMPSGYVGGTYSLTVTYP
ncbi:MAG: CSLREA domain-containing protein [Thermoflexales bacterium]|nr:CSLREA domain-containing protein [Thermoflexales bacterium]